MSGAEISDRFDIVEPATPQGVIDRMRDAFGTTWVIDLAVRPEGRVDVAPRPVSFRMDDLLPDYVHSGPGLGVTGRLAYPLNPADHSQGYSLGDEEAAIDTTDTADAFPLLISRALSVSDFFPEAPESSPSV
jgi:hypothetical protein